MIVVLLGMYSVWHLFLLLDVQMASFAHDSKVGTLLQALDLHSLRPTMPALPISSFAAAIKYT